MADQRFETGVVRDLVDETKAIGELARSEEAFRSAVAAFQSADRQAFQAILEKLRLTDHCRLVFAGGLSSASISAGVGLKNAACTGGGMRAPAPWTDCHRISFSSSIGVTSASSKSMRAEAAAPGADDRLRSSNRIRASFLI